MDLDAQYSSILENIFPVKHFYNSCWTTVCLLNNTSECLNLLCTAKPMRVTDEKCGCTGHVTTRETVIK